MAAPDIDRYQAFLSGLSHIVIATVREDGLPWAVPVKKQSYRRGNFAWYSKTNALHSCAIAANRQIAATAFSAKSDPGGEYGIYIEATVTRIRRLPGGIARYTAKITKAWYTDSRHKKQEIPIDYL